MEVDVQTTNVKMARCAGESGVAFGVCTNYDVHLWRKGIGEGGRGRRGREEREGERREREGREFSSALL